MDSFIQRQSVDLLRDNPILVRDQPIIKGDANALQWIVTVTKGGAPVDFTGATASLYCARAMLDDESGGTTWSSAATMANGTVTAVLPQDAANVAGPVGCTLRVTQNGASVTVARMAVMAIDPNGSDIVDVGKRMPNIDEVLAAVARCEEAASAAETAASNANMAASGIDSKITDGIAPIQKEVNQLKEDINDNQQELGFAVKNFSKVTGSSHSSNTDKLDITIKSGQKFYVTVSQTGSGEEFSYQLFAWHNGVSTRILNAQTSANKREITASSDYEQLSVYVGNDVYAGAAEMTLLFEQENSKLVEIETLKNDVDSFKPFFKGQDINFIDGYGVRYTDGTLIADSTYSYCEINVGLFAGTMIKGYSGTANTQGIAFYGADGRFLSGFGNLVSGTYNWNIDGPIPDDAVTAKIHCRKTYQENFWISLDWGKSSQNIEKTIKESKSLSNDIFRIEKKISDDIIIPILRNGSAGNSANANSVSTQYIYPIDFTKEKIVVEYLGDASLANQYAWGYCLFRGATDGMLSTSAYGDSSIQNYNYNASATERVSVPKYELPTTKTVNYDHIMFYLFRFNNDTVVPLRIATDQYNFRITLKEKDGEQSQRDIDLAETKHDLLFAKHAKNNTGPQLTLLHFSDLHADTVALARIMKDAEGIEYDDAICTGDIIGNSADRIESWWDESVLTCIGNHDSASYNSTDGYNWVALSMADRDAYYITPFKSNWGGVVHTSGKSYYYKDYADAKVRLIVMDAMLYSVYESDTSLGTEQTAWLNSLLSSAISNKLHVLIAIHAPHGGATAKDCSFSRYNQAEMPTYNDCNTPQSIIDAVATAIGNGLHFIGYLVGHTHQDNVWDAEGDGKQLMYCITCADVSNVDQWKASDQHRDEKNDAYNLVVIDTTNMLVKLIRGGGANMDDHMRTRKAICFNYTTGDMVGEVR